MNDFNYWYEGFNAIIDLINYMGNDYEMRIDFIMLGYYKYFFEMNW